MNAGRHEFRRFPLDGALLWFHPATGTHVRLRDHTTAGLRRVAPRVVMFGITNACNLRCGFCSRDVARESLWTVDTATALLSGLAAAGTLEVAFGGGEPFAFRGFADVVARLHETTPLALHVTTNGTMVDAAMWSAFEGRFGQARLSVYDGTPWRPAARVWAAAGQRWGANLLVDDDRLDTLPRVLADLAAAGCDDVALLSYVGAGLPRLSLAGRARLADVIADAPLACKLSVCLGGDIPVPLLFEGADGSGDCGAGLDFVAIGPDQRIEGCSFQGGGFPVRTADEVLEAWRTRQGAFARPSPRPGCARAEPRPGAEPPPVAVWQAFSGNNSGECILVGKFGSADAAETLVRALVPGWRPEAPYTDEWKALFAAAGLTHGECFGESPRALVAVGRSVLALGYDAEDAFPELRALVWKRGGAVVAGGIHAHGPVTLLAAIRCRDADDADDVEAADLPTHRHGHHVFVRLPADGLADAVERLRTVAGERPLAAELYWHDLDAKTFTPALQRLGVELPTVPRLHVRFYGPKAEEQAQALAKRLPGERVVVAGGSLIFDPMGRQRRRIAVLALRHGGVVAALDARDVDVTAVFWFDKPPPRKGTKAPSPPALDAHALARALGPGAVGTGPSGWNLAVCVNVRTDEPGRVAAAAAAEAAALGCRLNLGVADPDPLEWALRRLVADVRAQGSSMAG